MRLADVIAAAALRLGYGAAPGGAVEVKVKGNQPKSRMPSSTQQVMYYGFTKRRVSVASALRAARKARNVLRHRRACRG